MRIARLGWLLVLVACSSPGAELLLEQSEQELRLSNGLVRLVVARSSGQLTKLYRGERELLGRRGKGYVQSNDQQRYLSPSKTEMRVVRDDAGLIDVAFTHRHEFAVDYEWHYVLRPGESGFHVYFVYGSGAGWRAGARLRQLNYALRLDPGTFTHFFDGSRHGQLPSPSSLGAGRQVMDATFRLADGSTYTKYAHAADMDENHLVHGLAGEELGAWVVMPTHEYLNGAPFNRELTVHQTDSTPILLTHVQAAHFGSGDAHYEDAAGPWEKWGGPWFFYLNGGDSMAVREAEAKAVAQRLRKEWPYEWLKDSRFASLRGTVTGRLVDQEGKPLGGARVVLARALAGVTGAGLQQQWLGYRYFGWTDADGRFALGDVWPDSYRIYAWKDEVPGNFQSSTVVVGESKAVDFGELTWVQETSATVWQLGRLDRTAAEFGMADRFREWGLWTEVAKRYPNGRIKFDLDRQEATELPFLLAAYVGDDQRSYEPSLELNFELAEVAESKTAELLVAVADAVQFSQPRPVAVVAELNGEEVGRVEFVHGSAMYRSGIRGKFQEQTLTFSSNKLRLGQNFLRLKLRSARPLSKRSVGVPQYGVMWDALRLSVH